ncbi:MAG: NADPH:quinone reductase, partial [Pyrinomonadaceae bacterium]
MKAIRVSEFGGPEVMRLEDVPEPKAGAGQVVVRVGAAGVNPVDTYIRAGAYARKPATPYTPGSDAGGVIESVGEDVGRVRAGDRVYVAGSASGTYAELALCDESDVHPLPERASFAEGAAVYVPYATAYRALFQRARAAAGETVLVHGGSSGIGTTAIQLAKAFGARVFATAGNAEKCKACEELGADRAINYRDEDFVEVVK